MEYVYCAMLLHKAGKKIDEDSMEKVLTAVGITPDKTKIKATVTALKDVNIDKVVKEASVVAPVAAAPAAAPEKAAEKPKKKPEEKKKTEEEAAAGLGALFG